MTRKLYDQDSHIQAFEAVVCDCAEVLSGYAVELDQTAFFAEGGGQKADRGTLAGQPVLDVQEKDGHVFHYIQKPLTIGDTVSGRIDWPFRFTNMQQHSGEHILSGIAYAWKGYHNVGFHMNDAVTTIDFDGPLSAAELDELELRANRVIYENQPVTILYPEPEELAALDYRCKKKLTGAIRIVRVGDSDCCACCAPHVRYTGEVGLIKIIGAENYKGGIRLTIVCGERALLDYHHKNNVLKAVGSRLSAKPERVEQAVRQQAAELEMLKNRVSALSEALIQYKLREAQAAGPVCLLEPELDSVSARSLVNGLMRQGRSYAVVFLPKGEQEYQFVIGSQSEDVRPLVQALTQRFDGRGGGSAQMAQGAVRGEWKEIEAFLK